MVVHSLFSSFALPSRVSLLTVYSPLHREVQLRSSWWRRGLATRGRHRRDALPTLDPSKLTEECFRDLSNKTIHRFRTLGMSHGEDELHALSYASSEQVNRYPFPPAASGFLYYRSPPPGAPDIAGDIRFRVTNNKDPGRFASGTDFMRHGLPWLIPLVPNSEVSRRFLPSLLRDSLLTNEQVRRIERFSTEKSMREKEQPIYAFGQPCRLPTPGQQTAATAKEMWRLFWIFGVQDGEDRLKRTLLSLRSHVKWGYQQPGQPPKEFSASGTAIVHFERSTIMARKERRPVAHVFIRRMMHPFGSEGSGEHPDTGAVGCLLLVHTRRFGWREWRQYLDREPETPLMLLRDMPEGTEF